MSLSRFARAVTAAACALLLCASAEAAGKDRRELNLHNVNTNEDLRIVFKENGTYKKEAIDKLEWFFRDWRLAKSRDMDPKVFDLLSQIYTATGSDQKINVHSGYRSAQTNAFLRSRSSGVARESQHIEGKAIDFHIPGVPTKTLRELALKFQGGGVGYYPTSRSPFVHIDVADVRAWPKPSRALLVSLFPDGKTAHIPADGRPLPGYQEALAEIKGRKLGILSVIGDIAEFVKPKKKAPIPEAPVTQLAFAAPIPTARPALDPATAFMAAPNGATPVRVNAFVPVAPVEASQNPLFEDPFSFIEARRKLLRETNPTAAAAEKPITFKMLDIDKSSRHLALDNVQATR